MTFGALALVVATSAALADSPKVRAVDISAYKDKLQVLTDATGGTYVVHYEKGGKSHIFYGEGTSLYSQIVVGSSSSDTTWGLDTYSPRVWRSLRASIEMKEDGTYRRYCAENGDEEFTELTRLPDAAAATVIAKSKFLTSATMYVPFGLARDDKGVYYYVDQLTTDYGGKGYRLWIGKKGRMKQVPLADVSDDTGGGVFSTKTGDLHFVLEQGDNGNGVESFGASWVRGDKTTTLKPLNTFTNSWLIHSELGIYKFMGALCENQRAPENKTMLPH